MPSHNVLLPLIVLLGERTDEPMDTDTANGILYWFLMATIRNRYSASTDTNLGQDIPATRQEDPVRRLLTNLGVTVSRAVVTPLDLAGRTVGSPYFFLSYLVAKEKGAKDWWFGTEISAIAEGGQKLEYHHIHPKATLRNRRNPYSMAEINDLANLAFISGKANRKISDRSPVDYFADPALPPLSPEELAAHFVPYDEELRTADAYPEFLKARRVLLADAMTALVDKYRPSWLAEEPTGVDLIAGCSLDFQLYQSPWDVGRIIATATGDGFSWAASFSMADLEDALRAAREGLDSDLEIAGETVPVNVDNDSVEIPIGPFLVSGTLHDWHEMLDREKESALPLAQCPILNESIWNNDRLPFPVSSIE
jgi:hypothetical protein